VPSVGALSLAADPVPQEGACVLVAVPKETAAGERRVALVPDLVRRLVKAGAQVAVEAGAGGHAGFPDALYAAAGARVESDARALLGAADLVLKVQPPTAEEIAVIREGATLVGFLFPASDPGRLAALAGRRVTAFAMERVPRTSRAQSMDALSSQSSVAGYKAALIAADSLPRMFPLMMTAAGTSPPARVLVIGAGVAGLQAIATARRLGATVEAYDIRPSSKEEVASLGARFLEVPLEAKDAQDAGGYARAQSEEFLRKQAELMAGAVAAADAVITTAAVPGRRSPVLVTAAAVARMRPGSVIVDLAADGGGNCELTQPGQTIVRGGVTIHGPLNLPSAVAHDASQMYAHNIVAFVLHLLDGTALKVDLADDITRATLLTHDGQVVDAGGGGKVV
jgi:NAD(P) transhydrogenase subunit alpha